MSLRIESVDGAGRLDALSCHLGLEPAQARFGVSQGPARYMGPLQYRVPRRTRC